MSPTQNRGSQAMAPASREQPAQAVTRQMVEGAAARIFMQVRITPVLALDAGVLAPCPVVLKLEHLQSGGSFKVRGAFNTLLQVDEPDRPVMAASGGNHGIAVAIAAKALGRHAEIFVPKISSPAKVARLKGLGAKVHVIGKDFAEALEAMTARADATGGLTIHAYDDPTVVAGQGTATREFAMQANDVDRMIIAVGGGGLIAGALAWGGEHLEIISAEPEQCATLASARAAGKPVDVAVGGVAADSMGARRIGQHAFELATRFDTRCLCVSDAEIVAAQQDLWEQCRIVVEPGGAVALAALRSAAYEREFGISHDEPVGVLLCGGNTTISFG